MAQRNPPWPRGRLNGVEDSSMAYRNPDWPRGILNGPKEFLNGREEP